MTKMITQIRYSQRHDKDVWIPVSEVVPSDDLPLFISKENSRHSVLGVCKEFLAHIVARPRQSGWFMLDIDHSDLKVAIASGKALVTMLKKKYHLTDDGMVIALSGSKGIHVYLSPHLFYDASPMIGLAYIYREMAKSWKITGIDYQIYNEGKGRPVRPANGLRPDKRYKVHVTADELLSEVDESNYLDWVSKPRELIPRTKVTLNSGLSKLFQEKAAWLQENKQEEEVADAGKLEVEAELIQSDSVASCITNLLSPLSTVEKEATRDKAQNVLGIYLAHVATPEDVKESFFRSFAQNIKSSEALPLEAKIHQVKEGVARVGVGISKRSGKLTEAFCKLIKPMLVIPPACTTCTLLAKCPSKLEKESVMSKSNVTAEGWEKSSKIDARPIGYYTKATEAKAPIRLTTFRIERLKAIVEGDDDTRVAFHAIRLVIPEFNSQHVIDLFPAEAWLSKAAFKQALAGYEGAAFYGQDQDVTNIKHHLDLQDYALKGGLPVVTLSEIAGIHIHERPSKHGYKVSWVEPSFSVDEFLIVNETKYVGAESIYPSIKGVAPEDSCSPEAWESLLGLCNINEPNLVATLLGFMFYSHISQHLAIKTRTIGSLSIFGAAETGKSATVAAMMHLTGMNTKDAGKTLSPAGTTRLPYVKTIAGRSFPTVLNEVNTKSMSTDLYQYIMELVKSLYDCGVVQKGGLRPSKGQGVRDNTVVNVIQLRSPTIILSEEPITGETVQAVLDRLIPLGFTRANMLKHKEAYIGIKRNLSFLTEIGKCLVYRSVVTSVESAYDTFLDVDLPVQMTISNMSERRQNIYQMILTGFVWGLEQLADMGAPIEVLERIAELRDGLVESLSDEVTLALASTRTTELEQVLMTMATLAKIGANPSRVGEGIEKNREYYVEGNTLLLDAKLFYITYTIHQRKVGAQIPYKNETAFRSAIKSSVFYLSEGYTGKQVALRGTSTISLDLNTMQAHNVEIENFSLQY